MLLVGRITAHRSWPIRRSLASKGGIFIPAFILIRRSGRSLQSHEVTENREGSNKARISRRRAIARRRDRTGRADTRVHKQLLVKLRDVTRSPHQLRRSKFTWMTLRDPSPDHRHYLTIAPPILALTATVQRGHVVEGPETTGKEAG